MRLGFKAIAAVAAFFLLVQCGKKSTETTGEPLYGTKVELQPEHLPPPPAGMIYEAWELELVPSGANYAARYTKFARFGWNAYKYRFTHPQTGTDLGYIFKASPDDTTNLFTTNLTAWARADSIGLLLEKLFRGQSVPLPGVRQNLTRMRAFLLSMEPANETGPDTAAPASPFLVGYSNDSGKFTFVYPYNYRHPDFTVSFFLATPTDSLININKILRTQEGSCAGSFIPTDSGKALNETKGVWLGFLDTANYVLGIKRGNARPDTVLRKLARELLPGWQLEGWFQNRDSSVLVSLGAFVRADSQDLSNRFMLDPDSLFPLPGEDFLVNPPPGLDSTFGGKVMITLEPRPDPDPARLFPLVLFQDTVPRVLAFTTEDGCLKRNVQENFFMENRARFLPKIRARIIPEARK